MSIINEKQIPLVLDEKWQGNPVLILGDIHGEWTKLKDKIEYNNISDCIIMGVGDQGIGFATKQQDDVLFEALNTWFENKNILFICIRGNHDFPHRFDGSVNLSNFKLLQDYTYGVINGLRWGFVGGAISVDRIKRITNVSYWEDEAFVLRKDLIQECDVLITHDAPWWLGPYDKSNIAHWIDKEKKEKKYNSKLNHIFKGNLWEICKKERQEISDFVYFSKAKHLFCGHYHLFAQMSQDGCLGRILDILEILEFRHEQNP